jgi:hypothetical protein
MKKRLLTLAAGLIATAGVFAAGPLAQPDDNQYWTAEANYLWASGEYDAWEAVASKYLISFNPRYCESVEGLSGLTNFADPFVAESWSVGWGDRYTLTTTGSELSVNIDLAGNGTDKWGWSSFSFKTVSYKHYETGIDSFPTAATDSMGEYTVAGYVVDMSLVKKIQGEVFIPNGFEPLGYGDEGGPFREKFVIRVSFIDAHGHEMNHGGDCFAAIEPEEFGDWATFEIDYDVIKDDADYQWLETPGDGHGGAFNGMDRPIDGNAEAVAPVDYANIVGFAMYLEPSEDREADYFARSQEPITVRFRNLIIGDEFETVEYSYLTSINEEDSADEVVECKVVGNTVYAEGSLSLVNVSGQVVATGVDKVVAPVSGLYSLVTPQGSVQVIVE